ncbi:MAG TPA: hypothetical protein VFV05_04965 [Methylomirabilota bacterium]|nr:hypothetical protein [Methylomirabilota bacterium]
MIQQDVSWHQNGSGDAVAVDLDALVDGPRMAPKPKGIAVNSSPPNALNPSGHIDLSIGRRYHP